MGKSTIAGELIRKAPNALFLDLEKASDRQKVESDPELFFRAIKDNLICLDEIQLLPELFRSIRSHVDENQRNGQFLILQKAGRMIAVEIEAPTAPKTEKGFWNAHSFLAPDEAWIIGQVDSTYPGPTGTTVTILVGFLESFDSR